jgi:uncharacterized protein (TIRG00374 family)
LGSFAFILFLNNRIFGYFQSLSNKYCKFCATLLNDGGWIAEARNGLKQLTAAWLIFAVFLTVVSYYLFFFQCYLLAKAIGVSISYLQVSYAVSLGSLVTLLPISFSGLGTREAVMISYLSRWGVDPELALSLSLLIFITFYIVGGLMGAFAWWIKPIPLSPPQRASEDIQIN